MPEGTRSRGGQPDVTCLPVQRAGYALGAAALVLLVLAVYLPVMDFEFVNFDDNRYVTDNPGVLGGLTWQGVVWAFQVHGPSMWVPLTWLSHQAVVSLAGVGRPGVHHAVNLWLHAAAVLMLFAFLAQALRGAIAKPAAPAQSAGPRAEAPAAVVAWATAALWAVHPLHVESVAWVTERKDVLVGCCWMLTLLVYQRYVRRPGAVRYALVVGALVLALLAKPVAVTLPLVLLLLDFWPLRRVRSLSGGGAAGPHPEVSLARAVTEKLPLLALAAFSAWLTILCQMSFGVMRSFEEVPLALRAGNAVLSYAGYLRRLVWPAGLSLLYPYPDPLPVLPLVLSGCALIAATALALRWVRRLPAALVCWLWYLGVLAPTSGLIQAGVFAMVDHYVYLPAVGIYLGTTVSIAGWANASRRRRLAAVLAGGAAIALLAAAARHQTRYWKDSLTLMRRIVAVTPDAERIGSGLARPSRLATEAHWDMRLHLGLALLERGRLEEGIAELKKAQGLLPESYLPHYHLGNAYVLQGRNDRASEEYRAALALAPDHVPSLSGLAQLDLDANRVREALELLRRAAKLAPGHSWVRDRLGAALFLNGHAAEGIAELEAAAALAPWDGEIRRHLEEARRLAGAQAGDGKAP